MPDYLVTTSVFCTTEVIGFHRWPMAPDEVSYLRHEHRHKFGIRAEVSVEENDREVEFHLLRRYVESIVWTGALMAQEGVAEIDFGSRSCESLAHYVLNALREHYPNRPLYRVAVDEDGENGAIVEAVEDRLDAHLEAHYEQNLQHREAAERASV